MVKEFLLLWMVSELSFCLAALLLAWVRLRPVPWSWSVAWSKVQHHGKFAQCQVSTDTGHCTSSLGTELTLCHVCHVCHVWHESHQLWQSRGDQEEDGGWVAQGQAAAAGGGRGRGAGGPRGGGGARVHRDHDGLRDTAGQQGAVQGLQWQESRLCWGDVVFTLFTTETVFNDFRQRTRLQLMSFPLTRTLEDKKPFIPTR